MTVENSSPPKTAHAFLAGGGEMGERMRALDWTKTPLGRVENWPQSLRSPLSMMLPSKAQIILFWGPEFVVCYNDAYRPVFGAKHPQMLGQPGRIAWSEIWDTGVNLHGLLDGVVRTGEAFSASDLLFVVERHGFVEETYFDVSYDPVRDESGRVGGVFCIVTETTGRVVGERRLALLKELAAHNATARTPREACVLAMETLAAEPRDVPFALAYLEDELQACTCGAQERLVAVKPGQVREITLTGSGDTRPYRLVVGLNALRPFDEKYESFLGLVAGQLSTAIGNAKAYEDERRRAEALAELDRAKTAFFSNISHEFRTPLTLMLGPLEDALDTASGELAPGTRQRLETAHRNSLRLLKLVNSLLDFSRIEAGRVEASYEPTDLAALTADLASNFRSACERAGLQLVVCCDPLPEPAYVDREMWEKIVLNLLSNAFKFTFEGQIVVTLERAGEGVQFAVRDTGTGIPAAELPRMFERFHRVAGARGRTYEGTGIGLALVQELVKLHGGTISVDGVPGQGTTFTVTMPLGTAHLPADRVNAARELQSTALRADAFVKEALQWLPGSETQGGNDTPGVKSGKHILFADDNADMREYVHRLLGEHYEVEAVADGEAALAAARARRPDLIVTDVMMPKVDGFELIRELRAAPVLRDIPIVVLSARAGEEARIEGLGKGADDYLVKPFSARELLVRVEALLQSAAVRRQALEQERRATEVLREADRRKDEFLATLSHELRNPLAPIRNAVELLRDARHDATIVEQAQGILGRQVDHLTRLVDDLLELSRISQGSIVLQKNQVNLSAVVANAVEASRPVIDAAGHALEISLPEKPVLLHADAVRIAQILTNLLNNAAKYTRRGGSIWLTAKQKAGDVAVSVRDNGIGISAEMLPRIFDMFVRADTGRTRQDGLGIGLSLSQALANMHGASIEARSEGRGSGSEFILRLPIVDASRATFLPMVEDGAAASPRRVLVVDDNVDAAESLGLLLRQMGHEVRVAHDGLAAVKAASEGAPDVVLLDIGLPDIDGYAVAERLRKNPRLARLPIVAVTGRGREADRQRSREAGFLEHLTKPIAHDTLRALLSSVGSRPSARG